MENDKSGGQGRKTHEQFLRNLERKDDLPKPGETLAERPTHQPYDRDARQSEMPVSRGGMNQESSHNKHNDPGQSGHKPQQHSPAEEKR
jgi:hypothetical protein